MTVTEITIDGGSSSNVFKCTNCNFKAYSIENLNKHTRDEHIATKYPCLTFDFQADSMSSLRQHQLNKHIYAGAKPKAVAGVICVISNLQLSMIWRFTKVTTIVNLSSVIFAIWNVELTPNFCYMKNKYTRKANLCAVNVTLSILQLGNWKNTSIVSSAGIHVTTVASNVQILPT